MPSNPNAVLGETGARHLLKRCGFGGTPTDIAVYALLTRDQADYLVDRYSERKAEGRATVAHELAEAALGREGKKACCSTS